MLRKKTNDNSVKYIPQTERSQERDIKPNTIKNKSNPRKQKTISQNTKKLVKDFISAERIGLLK